MNFLFGNPSLLPLAALVAVPLLAHLFARTRPPRVEFSSVELLQQLVRQTQRMRKPRDWLLLILRTLLALGVVGAFLQPIYFPTGVANGAWGQRNVVYVIDATASMAASDGVQTRFAAACSRASRDLGDLHSGDQANVIWLRAAPAPVFPAVGSNFDFLRDALRREHVSAEAGAIDEALRLAADLLPASLPGAREIRVVSDFQTSTWKAITITAPAGIEIVREKVGDGDIPNGAITELNLDPPAPLRDEEVALHAVVKNFAPTEQKRTVFLEMAGNRQSKEITIPAWGQSSAVFRWKAMQVGEIPVTVSLNEDAFPADDRRWTVGRVNAATRVGLWAGDPGTARIWRQALTALGTVDITNLSDADLVGALPYDVLFLAGWNGAEKANLLQRREEGLAIVCAPSGATPWEAVAAFSGPAATLQKASLSSTAPLYIWSTLPDHSGGLLLVTRSDPLFAIFADGASGDPARGQFQGHWTTGANPRAGWTVLLDYSADQTPALARADGKGGAFYLWNLPLEKSQSNYAEQEVFVPLLGELVTQARLSANRRNASRALLPGEITAWQLRTGEPADGVVLEPAAGEATVKLRAQTMVGGTRLISAPLETPGLYEWRHVTRNLGYAVVNFPEIESDLRTIPASPNGAPGERVLNAEAAERPMREGIPLWTWFLALAAAMAMAEGGVLLWSSRR